MRLAVAVLAALAVLAAPGCGGDDSDALEGSWRLVGGIDLAGVETVPTANFGEDKVGGSTGCNRFNAPYTVDGDELELGEVATSLVGCPPPADEVERAYLDALGRVRTWRVEGETLVLLDAEGAELLRFTSA